MKYFVLLVCFVGWSSARKLPSYIDVCKPKHEDVGQCIAKNIEKIRPRLASKEGIPEMAIPSLNPLVIPVANITLGDFKAVLEDVQLYRVHEFEIEKLKVNLGDQIHIDLKLRFPEIVTLSKYTLKGKILILQLDGSGPASINVTNLEAGVIAIGHIEKRNGKNYINVPNINITPKVGNLALNLENLFPSNPELTANSNRILNENGNVIIDEFAPLVVDVIKGLIHGVLTNIFMHYNYETLFPGD